MSGTMRAAVTTDKVSPSVRRTLSTLQGRNATGEGESRQGRIPVHREGLALGAVPDLRRGGQLVSTSRREGLILRRNDRRSGDHARLEFLMESQVGGVLIDDEVEPLRQLGLI
jgi:hypothetical protein